MAPVTGVFRKPWNHWYPQRSRHNALLVASAANDLAQPLFTPVDAAQWHRYRDSLRARPWDFQQRPRWSVPAVAAGGGGPITIRGGTPAVGTSVTATVSVTLTGTRQPQTGDVLLIIHGNDFYLLSNMPTPTVGGSSTGVVAVTNGTADGGSNEGHVKSYTYVVGSAGDLTVSVTEGGAGDEEKTLVVYVLSGVDTTTPVDVAGNVASVTGDANDVLTSISPVTTDAYLVAHVNSGTGASGGAYASPGTMSEQYDQVVGGAMSMVGATQQLSASGPTGTRTFTPAVAVPWAGILVALRTAAGGAAVAVPWTPQRFVSLRDPGETFWLQPWRRLTDLVTQVDPLPSPLDSSFGVDGSLWHVYDDRRSTSGFLGQRAYYDPTLLTPAVVDVPTSNPLDWAAYYDRRLAPQQRPSFDLSLLAAPPADVPAPNPVDFATYADRRQVPRQRAAFDPTLLDTAQLEISPLPPRTMFNDRREVPQQRAYVSDPTLLDTAQLEVPPPPLRVLYTDRRAVPQQRPTLADQSSQPVAAFDPTQAGPLRQPNPTDRRLVPQQRTYFSEPGQPLDLTIFPGWQPYQTAALHVDRREVPQQRQYISDPSFYPQPGVTDPLTLAWGDGGTYWVIYNTAALQTSRRQVPQQRAYVSDPGLLLTALLEDPLLGGETLVHRMWFTDRRQVPVQWRPAAQLVDLTDPTLAGLPDWLQSYAAYLRTVAPQQRRYLSEPGLLSTALLEPPLTGGLLSALGRLGATHASRRLVPWQPNRWTVFTTAPAAVVNATSTPTVVAVDASIGQVVGIYTSAAGVTGSRTSASTAGGVSSDSTVTGGRSSTPNVSDG